MNSRITSRIAVLCMVGTASAVAQTDWRRASVTTNPSARMNHAMSFDAKRGETVLFGGYAPTANLQDTWTWDGTTWVKKSPLAQPSARRDHAMAFDASHECCVLFGGYGTGYLGDTWEWDGVTWTQKTLLHNPGARFAHMMAYDAGRGRIVLFGGISSSWLNDTWEYDGVDWVQMSPATSPPQMREGGMVYDAARGRIVLFGGYDPAGGGQVIDDTWEWNGTTWTKQAPANRPPGRFAPAVAYDPARERVVVFGGEDVLYHAFSDTWEYDGATWWQRTSATSPPASYDGALVYDPLRQCSVMFGGWTGSGLVTDTWLYSPTFPAATQTFGVACPVGLSEPHVATTLPWLGFSFTVTVSSLLPGDACVLTIGNSKTAWEGTVLPLDLGAIGMSSCWLYTNPLIDFGIVNSGGQATFATTILERAEWLGFTLYFQGFVVRPGANVLGVVATEAAETRFGGK